jgi:uncharacterized protein YlxW (UPF0749 family)
MSGAPPRTGPVVSHGAGLLEQWLQNPLDEGYAQAAARKRRAAELANGDPATGSPRAEKAAAIENTVRSAVAAGGPARRDHVWTAIGCLLIGLVLVIAYFEANRDAPRDARTRADLRARVSQAQLQGDALQRSAQNLAGQLTAARAGALGTGSDSALARAEAQAGTTAVRGPGVRVTLGNPAAPTSAATTGRAGTTPIGSAGELTDLDVRAVVNELWLDGAEAVAINGIRLTPTSAIRFAGEAVLVDFQPVTSPYVIEAIGDSNDLVTAFTASSVADKYRTLASATGLQFDTAQASSITMPANVLAQPNYASAPPTGAPSSGSTSAPSASASPTVSPS